MLTRGRARRCYSKMFDKILIANRGEIAVRVMKTAKKLGIKSVAVYSDADSNSMHVALADEAYNIGPAPSRESYLNMDKIVQVAKKSGAQAIHPGYGFLSENANFAELLDKTDIVFIGPPANAIRQMGSKSESKKMMIAAGVPVVPGYHGENQDPEYLKKQAAEIGYPVLIKAVSGGGGKGMRIVEKEEEFMEKLESSKRESLKSFNDDNVLVEKYLTKPRHVEVQVFADKHGNCVYLFERDCSVQRRHQKIIEEAPAPHLPQDIRDEMGKQAVNAAKAVGYVGAGTVEFILNADNPREFFFMEMNTRLQVEHPVTEFITRQDLVEWQLKVASGETLPMSQGDLKEYGHSFEARIYAENPRNQFLPDVGQLKFLRTPEASSTVRVETGVREHDAVSVHYDSMIAKLVVHGPTRQEALKKLVSCLDEYQIVGLHTNIDFLKVLGRHPKFIEGEVETGFIAKHRASLLPDPGYLPMHVFAQAVIYTVLREDIRDAHSYESSLDPYSPWSHMTSTRINHRHERKFVCKNLDDKVNISVTYLSTTNYDLKLEFKGEKCEFKDVYAKLSENTLVIDLEGQRHKVNIVAENDKIHVFDPNGHVVVEFVKPAHTVKSKEKSDSNLVTPMPCKIAHIAVKPGDKVKKGQALIVVEAMKMEHVIKAPYDGTVGVINYALNDIVGENKVLLTLNK